MDDLVLRAVLRDELSRPIQGVRREVAQLRREVDRTGTASAGADRKNRTFGLGLDRTGRLAGRAAREVGQLARRTVLFGTVAAGAAAAGIYKVGKAYNDQLNILQSVTRATGAQMRLVADEARRLGADMTLPATSAADAAAAMTELAKGGLSVEAAMKAAKGTLQLSAAASIEAAEAAQIQANTLNQFRLGAESAGYVADVLANSANAASGEITDMALALQYVGPVSQAMGISLGDTATAVSLLAKNGIIGQRAGTSIRAALAGLAAPSEAAKGALQDLRIEAFNASGEFIGMRPLIDQLAAAQKRMTREQFASAAATAFGREPLAAIAALAAEGGKNFDAMAVAVGRQGGAAEVAAARTKGLAGSVEGLKSQLETIGIDIYNWAQKPLEDLVTSAAERLPVLADQLVGVGKALFAGDINAATLQLSYMLTGSDRLVPVLRALAGGIEDVWRIAKAAATIIERDLAPALGILAAIGFGALLAALKLLAGGLELISQNKGVADVLLAIAAGFIAFKLAWFGLALVNGIRLLATGLRMVYATSGVVGVLKAITGAQWGLNAAMAANPVGVVIVLLVALAAGLYVLYQRSATARNIMQEVAAVLLDGVAYALDFVLMGLEFFLRALGKIPGFGWATKAADQIGAMTDKLHDAADALRNMSNQKASPSIKLMGVGAVEEQLVRLERRITNIGGVQVRVPAPTPRVVAGRGGVQEGDTARPRGAGSLGRTMAFHAAHAPVGVKVSSAQRSWGLGSARSDHLYGRALDAVGPGLQSYRSSVLAAGGFAEMHGDGSTRHLHVVPPGDGLDKATGDTVRPRGGSGGGGPAPMIEIRQTVVVTKAVPAEADVARGAARGLLDATRELEASGYVVVPGGRG